MSGDVFGNGMLLSKQTRLLAAFDHRDIFIDPDPQDLEASWAERKRLFEMERSSWQDYDAKLISKGGGRVLAHGQIDCADRRDARAYRPGGQERDPRTP